MLTYTFKRHSANRPITSISDSSLIRKLPMTTTDDQPRLPATVKVSKHRNFCNKGNVIISATYVMFIIILIK